MSNVPNEDEAKLVHNAQGSAQGNAQSGGWDSDHHAERETARGESGKQRIVSVKGGGRGKHNNPGNFANDRARAAAAGRKGGEARGRHHQQHQH